MADMLKIVHLLSFAVALGMTTANLITMRYAKGVEEAARPAFGPLGRSFGAYGVMAIALLWVTGIALLLLSYDVTALSGWVWTKLVLVVVLTGMVITVRKLGASAIAAGTPPPAALITRLMQGVLLVAMLVVVCAVVGFN